MKRHQIFWYCVDCKTDVAESVPKTTKWETVCPNGHAVEIYLAPDMTIEKVERNRIFDGTSAYLRRPITKSQLTARIEKAVKKGLQLGTLTKKEAEKALAHIGRKRKE